jgi:hypothetical protein
LAPEEPGHLVVLDLRVQEGIVVGEAHLFDPKQGTVAGEDWPAVSWAATSAPPGYLDVANGVVFVRLPSRPDYQQEVRPAYDFGPASGRLQWSYPIRRESMMLVMALPEGYTLTRARDAEPPPQGVKMLGSRMVLYWWMKPVTDDKRVAVALSLHKGKGNLRNQVASLSHELRPSHAPAPVMLENAAELPIAAAQRWWRAVNPVISHPVIATVLGGIILAVLSLWLTFLR